VSPATDTWYNVAIPNASAPPLTIGQAEGIGFFHGRLDEVRIYSHALSQAEIAVLATVPEPGTLVLAASGLIGLGAHVCRRRRPVG
jgi:hypothetical protein